MEQIHYSLAEVLAFEQRYRATLINSITGFKSLCLIGTKDAAGQTNLAVFSSLIHLGSNPPYLGIIIRPDSVDRHTLDNILSTNYYTINHVHEGIYQQAHQTSARYPKAISEFEATGLASNYLSDFFAPFVTNSHIQMGMQFKERIDIKLNNTILIIGEIQHLFFPKQCIKTDGFLDLELAQTLTCSGLDSYHSTHKIARLSYAKPDQPLRTVEI
jgi:flavin reductase (DIM6/NTAB) family NADH-FMN oxidoreductase RutF